MTWLYINCDLQHVNKGTAINRLLTEAGIELPKHIATGIPDQCPTNAVDLVLDDASLIYRSFANELFQLAISEGSRRTPEMTQELTSFLVLSGYHS